MELVHELEHLAVWSQFFAKLIYRLNAIPIKIRRDVSACLFLLWKLKQLNLSFVKCQELRPVKIFLSRIKLGNLHICYKNLLQNKSSQSSMFLVED